MLRTMLAAAAALLVLPAGLPDQAVRAAENASVREALTTGSLRVCADPNNLPFSNDQEEGFENRIAHLIADELGVEARFTWWPQTIGFVRNTLRLRRCDLISGISTTSELVQNTNPYYRSIYTLVYRADSGITATSVSDPQLKDKTIGVVAGTPPANLLVMNGMMANIQSYNLTVDTRRYSPARDAIRDVASGKTDAALVWGPLAGYFASQSETELKVIPLLEDADSVRLDFRVSMAVRYNETEWKHTINDLLEKLRPQIHEILRDYHVPLLDEQRRLM